MMSSQSTMSLQAVRWAAIGSVFVNLGIHLALAPDHLEEKFYIGVLFIIGSALLCMVAVGLASDHDRWRTPAWTGGGLVCAVEFLAFVFSRTTGLPGGYKETWLGETEDLLGLISLFVELVFITAAVVSLTRARRPGTPPMPVHDRTAQLA
jgi:hypothetical protein